ncbi:hypothetical protein TUBRATIS_30800 [Tubulinosema ratisbonensis]|uniref:Uncharacterized protein n=1 Tax=Tubulinosema ratisbonensis TaxID=291195 RepID=A0A437AH67_9MICR|nr:hypothetical protein TUBRATIS_30800 [Tubulinosema ratisbonensis]
MLLIFTLFLVCKFREEEYLEKEYLEEEYLEEKHFEKEYLEESIECKSAFITAEAKYYEKTKKLLRLFKLEKENWKVFLLVFYKKPIPNEKYNLFLKYGLNVHCKIQSGLKNLLLYFKKNNPNDKHYKKYKTNIQLYLDNFRLTNVSKIWYYFVLILMFLGGFLSSILILFFIKK